jgi:hypothetical protein
VSDCWGYLIENEPSDFDTIFLQLTFLSKYQRPDILLTLCNIKGLHMSQEEELCRLSSVEVAWTSCSRFCIAMHAPYGKMFVSNPYLTKLTFWS